MKESVLVDLTFSEPIKVLSY